MDYSDFLNAQMAGQNPPAANLNYGSSGGFSALNYLGDLFNGQKKASSPAAAPSQPGMLFPWRVASGGGGGGGGGGGNSMSSGLGSAISSIGGGVGSAVGSIGSGAGSLLGSL